MPGAITRTLSPIMVVSKFRDRRPSGGADRVLGPGLTRQSSHIIIRTDDDGHLTYDPNTADSLRMTARTQLRAAKAATALRTSGSASSNLNSKRDKAQLVALKKVLGRAQEALVELRRVRKVDAKSLNEPFTL